jgi:Ca2+/H+ antiporter
MLEVVEPMPPRRSTEDWLLEAIALAALIATFAMVFGHWQRLPGFARRGSSGSLSVMVVLNAGVYLLLTFASRYQQLVSVPFEIDRDRLEVKQLLLRMTIVLKTILMVLLAGLLWIIVHTHLGRMRTAGRGFLAVFLIAMLAPTLFYVRKLNRFRK